MVIAAFAGCAYEKACAGMDVDRGECIVANSVRTYRTPAGDNMAADPTGVVSGVVGVVDGEDAVQASAPRPFWDCRPAWAQHSRSGYRQAADAKFADSWEMMVGYLDRHKVGVAHYWVRPVQSEPEAVEPASG